MATSLVRSVLPTRLRLPDLLRATDSFADGVLGGRFDHLLPPGGLPVDTRWYTRLHADDDLDVWLISWAPGHTTELHDHGGSLGALTVLSGSLHEYRWTGDGLRRRRLDAGDQAAFPLGWVHDVGATGDTPFETLSVHAYSPPLTAMSYYETSYYETSYYETSYYETSYDETSSPAVIGSPRLRRTRTELTDQPEKIA